MITQHNKIAKIFAEYYTKISRDPYMKSNPKKYIRRKKLVKQLYNKLFTERHLKAAIKNNRKIQHQVKTPYIEIIKILPPETLKYLLGLYNKIWEEGVIPEG